MSDLVCFFDTETTGLPRPGGQLDQQPHVVQIAASLQEPGGVELACFSVLVRPVGFVIPREASEVHGITTERATRCGVAINVALGMLNQLTTLSSLQVAHNAKFDDQLIRFECERLQKTSPITNLKCSAERATPVVGLPPTPKMIAAGRKHHKTPNLAECVRFFFAEDLKGAHDAMVDVKACARVWWALDRLGKN